MQVAIEGGVNSLKRRKRIVWDNQQGWKKIFCNFCNAQLILSPRSDAEVCVHVWIQQKSWPHQEWKGRTQYVLLLFFLSCNTTTTKTSPKNHGVLNYIVFLWQAAYHLPALVIAGIVFGMSPLLTVRCRSQVTPTFGFSYGQVFLWGLDNRYLWTKAKNKNSEVVV